MDQDFNPQEGVGGVEGEMSVNILPPINPRITKATFSTAGGKWNSQSPMKARLT